MITMIALVIVSVLSFETGRRKQKNRDLEERKTPEFS